MRWGRVQMTQRAEIARTINIKYVHAESSRWLLHRRRDTKKINLPGCREKVRKERTEKRKVGSKAQKASKKVVLKAYPQQQIFYLLYSGTWRRWSIFYKKLKNVSCEYDRVNGWNSTLQAAWYIRYLHKLSFARVLCFILMKDIGRWLPWMLPGSTGRFFITILCTDTM